MKKNVILYMALCLSCTGTLIGQPITFQKIMTDIQGISQGDIGLADIDGDGDQDILVTGSDNNSVESAILYKNDGNGSFSEVQGTPFLGVSGSDVAFADVDGDNDQDVVISGVLASSARYTQLFLNDGTGVFTADNSNTFAPIDLGDLTFFDAEGDGDQDLLITGFGESSSVGDLMINDGNGNFAVSSDAGIGIAAYSSVAYADIDGDNDLDLIISGFDEAFAVSTKLYTNDGDGTFTLVQGTPFPRVAQGSIAFSDIDKDGDQDVLITGGGIDGNTTNLYTNDGSGNFTLVNGTPFQNVVFSAVAFADVDGDDDDDLLITGSTPSEGGIAALYENDGYGSFTDVSGLPFLGVSLGSVAFADINADDKIDLVIAGGSSGVPSTSIYENTTGNTSTKNLPAAYQLSIMPNPTTEFLNISTEIPWSWERFTIYDARGATIKSGKNTGNSIDVGDLGSGAHVIQMVGDDKVATMSFMKQ